MMHYRVLQHASHQGARMQAIQVSPTNTSHSGIWNMTLMALVWSALRAHSKPSVMPWAVKGNLWLIMGARSIWPVVIISMQSGYCTHRHPVNEGGRDCPELPGYQPNPVPGWIPCIKRSMGSEDLH